MIGVYRGQLSDIQKMITDLENVQGPLPGLATTDRKKCWAQQIISSLRRIEYTNALLGRKVDSSRCNPNSGVFDPIKGAIYLNRQGDLDEALWLTFILTHFGKHAIDGWKLASNVYGSFGDGPVWTYAAYSTSALDFENMLMANVARLQDLNVSGRFSNHRKFESKKPEAISRTFRTFHEWQSEFGGFRERVMATHAKVGQEPRSTFHELYISMKEVSRFGGGRLGRFDFLTMVGKLQIAPIVPGSVYLDGASGPLDGARLLFFGNRKHPITGKALEARIDDLDDILGVGKQVIEDSLCNWQKSPDQYRYFRG